MCMSNVHALALVLVERGAPPELRPKPRAGERGVTRYDSELDEEEGRDLHLQHLHHHQDMYMNEERGLVLSCLLLSRILARAL